MQPGFIAAMKSECLTLSKSALPGEVVPFGKGALLVLSGIGRKRAAAGVEALIKAGAGAMISWGFAAGIEPGIAPGTLVLPEAIVSRNGGVFATDQTIYELIRSSPKTRVPHVRGLLAEADRVLKNGREKAALFRKTGALAADMESAAAAEAAAAAGLPFSAVRVILDDSMDSIPACVLTSVDEYGRFRFSRFIRKLSLREIPGLAVPALHQWRAHAVLKRIGKAIRDLEFKKNRSSDIIGEAYPYTEL